MFRFFRSFREKAFRGNQVARYLSYAFGEIILVVVGILIALSINTWNEERKSRNDTRLMLMAIRAENELNQSELQDKIIDATHVRTTLITLLGQMGEGFENKNKRFVDSLLFEGLSMTIFDPNKASFDNFIRSGNIRYVQNDSLHDALLKWSSYTDALIDSEQTTLHTFKTIVIPHFYDKISLVSIDHAFNAAPSEAGSAFDHDNRSVLNSMETENIIEDHLYNLGKIERRYRQYFQDSQSLNTLINNELSE